MQQPQSLSVGKIVCVVHSPRQEAPPYMIKTSKATSLAHRCSRNAVGLRRTSSAQTVVSRTASTARRALPLMARSGRSARTRTGWIGRGSDSRRLPARNGVSFARLRLDTYNPDQPGVAQGHRDVLEGPPSGWARRKEIERAYAARLCARAGLSVLPLRRRRGVPRAIDDEIDVEFLGNFPTSDLLLTGWNDWNSHSATARVPTFGRARNRRGLELECWNTYKSLGSQLDQVFVNGALVRTNWAPNMHAARSSAAFLQLLGAELGLERRLRRGFLDRQRQQNVSYLFDVDWLRSLLGRHTPHHCLRRFSSPLITPSPPRCPRPRHG
jgi:hypothetical protein